MTYTYPDGSLVFLKRRYHNPQMPEAIAVILMYPDTVSYWDKHEPYFFYIEDQAYRGYYHRVYKSFEVFEYSGDLEWVEATDGR